jgi:hypothetical protein
MIDRHGIVNRRADRYDPVWHLSLLAVQAADRGWCGRYARRDTSAVIAITVLTIL